MINHYCSLFFGPRRLQGPRRTWAKWWGETVGSQWMELVQHSPIRWRTEVGPYKRGQLMSDTFHQRGEASKKINDHTRRKGGKEGRQKGSKEVRREGGKEERRKGGKDERKEGRKDHVCSQHLQLAAAAVSPSNALSWPCFIMHRKPKLREYWKICEIAKHDGCCLPGISCH